MQIMRHFNGQFSTVGSAANRKVTYGIDGTLKSQYTVITDFLNSAIATFLKEDCGIDAEYEQRDGSDASFLFVFGIPFLFIQESNQTNLNIYGPYRDTNIATISSGLINKAYSDVNYDFWLVFTGNPNVGFCLRYINYTNASTGKSTTTGLRFNIFKAKNILTEKDSIVWNIATSASINPAYYGVDLKTAYEADWDAFLNEAVQMRIDHTFPKNIQDIIPGKIPLYPVEVASYRIPGAYQYPMNIDLPLPSEVTVVPQTEVQIGDRRFLITMPTNTTNVSSFISMPIIDMLKGELTNA